MTEPPQDPLPIDPQPTDLDAPGTEPTSPVSANTEPPQAPLPVDTQIADLDEPGAEPASTVSADAATNTANPAQKPILAAIVSEASKSLSGKIFLSAWFATIAITGITFSISYLKASNWLNRGKEIAEGRNAPQTSCVQRHFQGMLPSVPNPNQSDAANAEESLESLRRRAFAQRQEINTRKLELVTKRNALPKGASEKQKNDLTTGINEEDKNLDELDRILRDLGYTAYAKESLESLRRDAIAQRQEINTRKLELVTQRNDLPKIDASGTKIDASGTLIDASKTQIDALKKQTDDLKTDINEEDKKLNELDKILRNLGMPRISMGEVNQLWEQDQSIQERIYVHYDITRTFYATHQAGSVGAALALLFGSIVLIFITSDIWEGKIKNNPGLVFPLILFGSTYILFLNLPTVLSAEEIYQANLAQYVGYINLEEEICTVLATERFVGDPDQPGTIQEIQFNRLVHSVEQRMRELNTRTITSNVGAIDRLRFDLDALSYPRTEKPK